MSAPSRTNLKGLTGLGLRPKRFWTPRYIRDRLALEALQRRSPHLPWLTREAIALLEEMLRPTDACFEWGSGRSTVWIAPRVAEVFSVEDDRGWCQRVNSALDEQGIGSAAVHLASSEPDYDPSSSDYVQAISEFGPETLDVVIVDGKHRSHCALAALPKIAPGGVLLVDNAERYLDHKTHSPHSRYGRGPLDARWAEFEVLTAGWRKIWTTNGVSDTGLWICP